MIARRQIISRGLKNSRGILQHPAALLAVVALAGAAAGAAAAGVPFTAQQQAAERAEGMYFQAEEAIAGGDTDEALRILSTIVTEHPRGSYPEFSWRAVAGVRAGEIEMRLGRDDAAAAHFVSVIEEEAPSSATSRARYGLATTLIWAGEWRAAVSLLQSIVTAADSDTGQADRNVAAVARQRLSMAHRLWLRPLASQLPWTQAGRYAAAGDLDRPVGVAANEAGAVLIADEGSHSATLVDAGGVSTSFSIADLRRPWWGLTGSAYIATKAGVVAPQRGESYQFAVPNGAQLQPLRDVRAGVRDGAGQWILVDNDADSVVVFSAGGAYLRSLDLGPGGEPVDVAAGQRGYVYVIEKHTRTVLFFAPDGTPQGGFALNGWRQPYAVAADGAGHVYVLDRDAKRIDVFDPEGGIRWSLGPVLPGGVELRDPRDLAVDGAGRLLIADRGLSSVVIVE